MNKEQLKQLCKYDLITDIKTKIRYTVKKYEVQGVWHEKEIYKIKSRISEKVLEKNKDEIMAGYEVEVKKRTLLEVYWNNERNAKI